MEQQVHSSEDLAPRRLDKYLSDCNVGPRKIILEMALESKVTVNGEIQRKTNHIVDPATDIIHADGVLVKLQARKIYALLNKPMRCVTTMAPGSTEKNVCDIIPKEWHGLARPVGRLDRDTTGALVITDDGNLQVMMTQPEFNLWKTYMATVHAEEGQPPQA